MCKLCKIESLLFCLLCFVSIFFYSHHMTDTYIVPKWCFTLLVLLVSIFVLSIKKLCNKTIRIDIVWLYHSSYYFLSGTLWNRTMVSMDSIYKAL